MNQSEFPAITWNLLKEGERCTHKVPPLTKTALFDYYFIPILMLSQLFL